MLKFKKHFIEILLLLEKSPMSFNELLKALNAYPDTLNRRLKELQSLNLIVQFEENGKIKYKLTDKGLKLIPLLRNLLKIIDEIKSLLS